MARRLGANESWLSPRRAAGRALQLQARRQLCSAPGLPPRVGSETSAAAEVAVAAARGAAGGGAAAATRPLLGCHPVTGAPGPSSSRSLRPRSPPPSHPPPGSGPARRRSHPRRGCQAWGSAGRGISPSPALGRPPTSSWLDGPASSPEGNDACTATSGFQRGGPLISPPLTPALGPVPPPPRPPDPASRVSVVLLRVPLPGWVYTPS